MAVKNKKLWLIYMIYDCNSISAVSQPVNISSHWIKPPVLLKWTQEAVGFIHCQRDEWHSVSKQRRRKSCPRHHSIRGCSVLLLPTWTPPVAPLGFHCSSTTLQRCFSWTKHFPRPRRSRVALLLCVSAQQQGAHWLGEQSAAASTTTSGHTCSSSAAAGRPRSRCSVVMWPTGPPEKF